MNFFNVDTYKPLTLSALFQASDAVQMKSSYFWDVKQRRVLGFRSFETTDRSHLNSWRWDRYIIPKRRKLTTHLRCVTSKKSEELNVLLTTLKVLSNSRRPNSLSFLSMCYLHFVTVTWYLDMPECIYHKFRISFFTICNISFKTDITKVIITKRAVFLFHN